ncbi:MAG: adenylate kinase [Candidatus Parcubacteria bacterium]|jgi:adenylate kinase
MNRKRLRAVIFGPQGSGKGTQGEILADRFDVPLIGAGDLFRAEIAKETQFGKIARTYVASGSLAPDELVNGIMGKQLKALDVSRGFILDGYPRNVEQAQHLHRVLPPNVAISIKISDAMATRRLLARRQCTVCEGIFSIKSAPMPHPGICSLCGGKLVQRGDDHEEAIRARLAAYHFMTEPLSRYYREQGILLQVNGEQEIPYVFEDLTKKLAKLGFVA